MSQLTRVEQYCIDKGWSYRNSGNQVVLERCPFCNGDNFKFFINEETFLWDCKRGACGRKGNEKVLKAHMGDSMQQEVNEKVTAQKEKGVVRVEGIPNIQQAHEWLLENDELKNYLWDHRGWDFKLLERMKIGIMNRFISDEQKEITCFTYPYIINGKCEFVKFRTLPGFKKNFASLQGRQVPLYNQDVVKPGMPHLIMTEGECFRGETEILTCEGFIRFDQYKGQDVAQWNHDGTASYVRPLAVVDKEYDGDLVSFATKSKSVNITTTAEHRILYRHAGTKKWYTRPAADVPNNKAQFVRCFHLATKGIGISDNEIRLWVALQADGSLQNGNCDLSHGCSDGLDRWVAEFKKTRKIERLRLLLTQLNCDFKENVTSRGTTFFTIWTSPYRFAKTFPTEFYQMNAAQRKVFIEEVPLWDGHGKHTGEIFYGSVIETNADLIQWAYTASGFHAHKGIYRRPAPRQDQHWVSISARTKRGSHQFTCGEDYSKTVGHHKGRVYCVTVPSGYIVTRQDGCITVQGNCDTLSVLSLGEENVVGVPGAGMKQVTWSNLLEYPQKKILLFDNDEDGQKGAKSFAERFGIDQFHNVLIPEFDLIEPIEDKHGIRTKGKDITEWIATGKTLEDFKELIASAEMFSLDGVSGVRKSLSNLRTDIEQRGDNLPKYDTQWNDLNKAFGGAEDGHLVIIQAAAKTGKTSLALNWADYLVKDKKVPCLFECLEMPDSALVRKWASYVTGTDDTPGNLDYKQVLDMLDAADVEAKKREYEILFGYTTVTSLEAEFERLKSIIRRYGIKVLFFDNLQFLVDKIYQGEKQGGRPAFMSKITKMFKSLAMEMKILVVLIAQTKGLDENAVATAGSLEGSRSPSNDCDTMMIMNRTKMLPIKDKSELIKMASYGDNTLATSTLNPELFIDVGLTRLAPGGLVILMIDGSRSLVYERRPDQVKAQKSEGNQYIGDTLFKPAASPKPPASVTGAVEEVGTI
jgi:KaiC/GvpD/RAD55 family RecA-like ATPase